MADLACYAAVFAAARLAFWCFRWASLCSFGTRHRILHAGCRSLGLRFRAFVLKAAITFRPREERKSGKAIRLPKGPLPSSGLGADSCDCRRIRAVDLSKCCGCG